MGQATARTAQVYRPPQPAGILLADRIAALEAERLAPVPRASHTAAVDIDDLALLLDRLTTATRAARVLPAMPQETSAALERLERTVRAHGRLIPDAAAGSTGQSARPRPAAAPAGPAVSADRRQRVPAAPTTLRLRALIVMKWPLPELAARSGVTLGTLRALAGGLAETTSAETEQAVIKLSASIADQPGPTRPDAALAATWASGSPAAAGSPAASASRAGKGAAA